MNLETAVARLQQTIAKIDEAYQRPVFDEIAVVALSDSGIRLHHYQGPDEENFRRQSADKTLLLRRELDSEKTETGGEFGFTREAEGESFDAYICLGPSIYLFCNNTQKSMEEITADPRWLEAQKRFFNASQIFAADPVRLA